MSNVINAAARFAEVRLEADVIRANEATTQAAVDHYIDLLIEAHQRQETMR